MKKIKTERSSEREVRGESHHGGEPHPTDGTEADRSLDQWLEACWDTSSSEMDQGVQDRLFETIKLELPAEASPAKERTHRRIYRSIGRYAAVLILMCLTGAGVYFYTISQAVQEDLLITVNKGQKTNITLPDGSIVWINSESKLSYGSHFNAKERFVRLEGEAFFDVAHDKNRPFIVEAKEMRIEVHGTEFNVNTKREKMSVSLLSGAISLQYKKKESLMNPGEVAYCSVKDSSMEVQKKDVRLAALWTRDHLQFKNQSLKEIAPILSEWYGVDIVVDSSHTAKEAYSFTLRNETLEEVLLMMSMINPIAYKYEQKDRIRIYSKK